MGQCFAPLQLCSYTDFASIGFNFSHVFVISNLRRLTRYLNGINRSLVYTEDIVESIYHIDIILCNEQFQQLFQNISFKVCLIIYFFLITYIKYSNEGFYYTSYCDTSHSNILIDDRVKKQGTNENTRCHGRLSEIFKSTQNTTNSRCMKFFFPQFSIVSFGP